MSSVIVRDIETVPDIKGFAAANGHEIRLMKFDSRPMLANAGHDEGAQGERAEFSAFQAV
jgi:hypothetical protein